MYTTKNKYSISVSDCTFQSDQSLALLASLRLTAALVGSQWQKVPLPQTRASVGKDIGGTCFPVCVLSLQNLPHAINRLLSVVKK